MCGVYKRFLSSINKINSSDQLFQAEEKICKIGRIILETLISCRKGQRFSPLTLPVKVVILQALHWFSRCSNLASWGSRICKNPHNYGYFAALHCFFSLCLTVALPLDVHLWRLLTTWSQHWEGQELKYFSVFQEFQTSSMQEKFSDSEHLICYHMASISFLGPK